MSVARCYNLYRAHQNSQSTVKYCISCNFGVKKNTVISYKVYYLLNSQVMWNSARLNYVGENTMCLCSWIFRWICFVHTHTHTRLTALCPWLPGWARTRKVKPIWILLKQETVSGSGIGWAICKCASRSRQITLPGPHHSVFYRPDALPATQPTAFEMAIQWNLMLKPIEVFVIIHMLYIPLYAFVMLLGSNWYSTMRYI